MWAAGTVRRLLICVRSVRSTHASWFFTFMHCGVLIILKFVQDILLFKQFIASRSFVCTCEDGCMSGIHEILSQPLCPSIACYRMFFLGICYCTMLYIAFILLYLVAILKVLCSLYMHSIYI